MHKMDKIEYSRGRSLNICDYSIFFVLSFVFFPLVGAGGIPTSIIGSEKYSILSPVTINGFKEAVFVYTDD